MHPSTITTLLTISTFSLGLLFCWMPSLQSLVYSLSITISIAYIVPTFNHLTKMELMKCLITTYIFGVLHGLVYVLWDGFSAFGLFLVISTIRFYGEFQLVNCFHHHELQWQSFLIYHSKMYTITNIFLIAQHILTRYILDLPYKHHHILMQPALVLTCVSTMLRILAFFTARQNFTHKVSYNKKSNHRLVTTGIYSILRHPSYTGFFYFSVFSMVLIGNFLSAFLFAAMLSVFFFDRIRAEEALLVQFFGTDYLRYRKTTWVLIPYFPEYIRNQLPHLRG